MCITGGVAKRNRRSVETQCIASLHSSSPAWGEIIVAVIDNLALAGRVFKRVLRFIFI
jgi:hypothetical protein